MSITATEAHENQGRRGTVDGMRREWNFSLTFAHQAARIIMQLSPHWENTFIDPREIEKLNRLDRDVKHCPMMPALRYTDLSAVMKPNNELWTEIPKCISILYSHIPPDMTLAAYCIRSVQHVLSDPHVVSVDGFTDLSHLKVDRKLHCPYRLGGHRSFHFRYHVSVKSKLIKDIVYAIGTIINQRGYLCTVQCSEEEELDGYVLKNFLPQFTNPDKFALDQDIIYEEMTSSILKEQQELFGELRYFDADAAVAFSIPMHPMRIRPDFSPTQTVGVGSIACMTLELDVHQRLIDDFAEADITGMPKYKINPVILFIDVEDVARMGYPRIMSTEQYSNLKIKRLLEIFNDAKLVGTPATNYMGIRTGRSRIVTLTYEPFNAVVKVMTVSAIVGSFGVSAVFLTKLAGGLFDAHLYLYQQLLKGIKFREKNASEMHFSRFRAVNVRLMEQIIPRAYNNAPVDERQVMEKHLKFLRESNDGRVEGAIVMTVTPEEGGLEKKQQNEIQQQLLEQQQQQQQQQQRRFSDFVESNSSQLALFRGSDKGSDPFEDEGGMISMDEEENSIYSCLGGSFHSSSIISVTSITHLHDAIPYDAEDEEERNNNDNNKAGERKGKEDKDEYDGPLPKGALAASPTESNEPPSERSTLMHSIHSIINNNNNNLESTSPSIAELGERETTSVASLNTADRNQLHRLSTTSAATERGENGIAFSSSVIAESHPTSLAISTQQEQQQEEGEEEQQRLLREALKDEEADVYFGPSLHDIYVSSCDMQRCRPNSYLLKKLPTNPRFTNGVRELDLSSNYLGHSGFLAVLNLIEHLPRLRTLYFNDMSLDNIDAENLCEVLLYNQSVRAIYLRNNNKITLPATRYFTRLLRTNTNIVILSLEGTRLGDTVIKKLEEDAKRNAAKRGNEQV